jgi:hypothetical protein
MSKSARSKYACNALLFKPEPPVPALHVKRLFHGRESELQRGLQTLKQNFDVGGKRSKGHDNHPWVIHGESRSGKSHLARRIFAEFPSNKERIQFLIPAKEKLQALAVMKQMFEELHGEFGARVYDQRLPEDYSLKPQVCLVNQLISKISLFTPETQTVTLTLEGGAKNTAEGGFELGGAPLLAKFLAKVQTERTEKQSIQVALRPPTPLDLAQVCGIMIEALLRLRLINHALILVDDVDLLEGYASPQQNAREQRSLLAEALDELHGTPGVDVVLTARSWYAHTRKEFQTLVDLAESPLLTPDELAEIQQKRLKLYAGKNGPTQFLSRPALLRIAEDVGQLPGVFLLHLDTAFYQYQNEPAWEERDYDWFLDVFRRRFTTYRDKCSAAAEALEKAIRDGQPTVSVTTGNPFLGTVFEDEFVYQSYYSETTYFISGVIRKVLAPLPAGDLPSAQEVLPK